MSRRNPQQLREAQVERRESYLIETGQQLRLFIERDEREAYQRRRDQVIMERIKRGQLFRLRGRRKRVRLELRPEDIFVVPR